MFDWIIQKMWNVDVFWEFKGKRHLYLPVLYVGLFHIFALKHEIILQCGPMPNVMAALSNIGGALCSTPQSLAHAQYWSAVQ